MGNINCMPAGFQMGLATELANLVMAAYDQFTASQGKPAPRWPPPADYQILAEFSATPPTRAQEKFGFVARRTATGGVYVVFRGTESPDDWLANVDFVQVPQKNGWGNAEKGFSGVYVGCAADILGALNTAGNPGNVIVTGHSLGGSLATLCAADIRATTGANVTLYTFASPRSGDQAFAARFNTECPRTWRIANTEDIVNTVPLAATAVEALHLGGLSKAISDVAKIPIIGTEAKEAARHLAFFNAFFSGLNYEHVGTPVDFTQHNGDILHNHQMATYLAALTAAQQVGVG